MKQWLREQHDLMLDLTATAPTDAVEQAIQEGGVGPITFRKLEHPSDLFANEDDWWSDGDDLAVAEYSLRPARGRRFTADKLLGFVRTKRGTLEDDEEKVEFPELAAFDDHEYDQIAVTLWIHGRKKTVYFDRGGPSMPHAFSWELELVANPSDTQLVNALSELLPGVDGPAEDVTSDADDTSDDDQTDDRRGD